MATKTITVIDDVLATALGGAPSAGDSVYVDRTAIDFTSATLANDLLLMVLSAGFSGRFLSSLGGALNITCDRTSTGVFRNESNSPVVELRSTSASGVIYEIRNRPASGGVLQVSSCKPTIVHQHAGVMRLEADVDLSAATLRVHGGEAIAKKTGGAATYPLLNGYCYNGRFIIERDVTTLYARGRGLIRLAYSDCSPTTVNLDGGTVEAMHCSALGTLQGDNGVFDERPCKTPFTVTTRAVGPGVTILRRRNSMVTYSSTSGDYGGGPTIIETD